MNSGRKSQMASNGQRRKVFSDNRIRRLERFSKRLGVELLEDRRLLSVASPQIELFNASPALFVENQGQWADASVRFVHQGNGANVAMTDQGPVFQVLRKEADTQTEMLQFSASFPGANTVVPTGFEASETKFNYCVGDSSNWHSDVSSFQKVAYTDLYPGIDLQTWGQRSHLKYEFHVAPGADYRQIEVHYAGIDGLSLNADGSLQVNLGGDWGLLTDDAPYIYQVIDGRQVPIAGKFTLLDSQTYTFTLSGDYDHSRELVIDPDLSWATYLGGSGNDQGKGIAVDNDGNAFVTGTTTSADFAGSASATPRHWWCKASSGPTTRPSQRWRGIRRARSWPPPRPT